MSGYNPEKIQYVVKKINIGFLSDDGSYRAELDLKTRVFDNEDEAEHMCEIGDIVVRV